MMKNTNNEYYVTDVFDKEKETRADENSEEQTEHDYDG